MNIRFLQKSMYDIKWFTKYVFEFNEKLAKVLTSDKS